MEPTAGGCTNGTADDEGAGSERESGPKASTIDGDDDNDEEVVVVAAEEEEEEDA